MTRFFLPIYRKVCLGLVSLALLASAAVAQNATVIGPITPGDIPVFNSATVIKDSGSAPTPNAITALTGDVTATGPGSAAATIALNAVTNAKAAQMLANTVKCNPTGSTANAQDCTNFFLQSAVAGQPATQVGNLNPLSFINQASDNINAGSGFIEGLAVNYAFGGSSMQGGRASFYGQFQQTAVTSASSTNRNYVAVQGTGLTQTGDGGSAPTKAGGKGAYFSFGGNTFINAAATNVLEASGGEIDTDVQSGASMAYLIGWSVVGVDAVQGSVLDAAYEVGGATNGVYGPHAGWNYGLVFSDVHGNSPVNSNSTLVGGFFPTLGTQTIKHGIDLSAFTCSTDCFKSASFTVDGSGNVSTNKISATTTGAMPLYGTTGTALNAPHTVNGAVALATGSATVTFSGAAVFGGTNNYVCSANDATAANAVSSQNQSATQVKFVGTGTDTVSFVCVGN